MVFLKKLTIQNVKSFGGVTEFEFTSGLNYLVGDNNCGKTSIFEAMLYLSSGKLDADFGTRGESGPVRVEAVIAGEGLRDLLSSDKFSKYAGYLYEDSDGDEVIRLERSTQERVVEQNGKAVSLDGKKVCFWSSERTQFENPTGIDALFKALIEFHPIWADTDPTDYADFSSTKTLGRLIDSIAKDFFATAAWTSFVDAHRSTFSATDSDSIVGRTKVLANEIEHLVADQYGYAKVRFDFGLPEPAAFLKQGLLVVDDGFGETALGGKGTGMQRAFALAIIQLYARFLTGSTDQETPLLLLVDEPETWLHPKAQLRLADALALIAQNRQLFLITHSPYLLRRFEPGTHELVVLSNGDTGRSITYARAMGYLGPGAPTWGEINFHAFGIASHEFHNELYGLFQARLSATLGQTAGEKEVDNELVSHGADRSKSWIRDTGKTYPVTLPVYVRNAIHHPENVNNAAFTEAELHQSTSDLLNALGTSQFAENAK